MMISGSNSVDENAFARQDFKSSLVDRKDAAQDDDALCTLCVLWLLIAGRVDGCWVRGARGTAWVMPVCDYSRPYL